MSMKGRLGALRRQILTSTFQRNGSLQGRLPVVSFCFDDFPRTAFTTAGPILRNYGARATYYAAPGLINSSNELGELLKPEDIDALVREGHEIGSHTFSHASCRPISLEKFKADVMLGQQTLRSMTGCEVTNFAYPFGHISLSAKRTLGPLLGSSRGIYGGVNGRIVDLNLLRANSLYGEIDQLEKARLLLQRNEKACGWLIFYTHDVRPNPSPFGCTPELFESVVSLVRKMACHIATVDQVISTSIFPMQESVTGDPSIRTSR